MKRSHGSKSGQPSPDLVHQGATIGALFVRATQRFSERVALVAEGRRWTYQELASRVARMVAVLRRSGLRPGDGLAILSHNKPDVLVVYFAAMVAGFRMTPLGALSSVEDQAFILDDAEIAALVVDGVLSANLSRLRNLAPALRTVFALGPCSDAPDLSALTDAEPLTALEAAAPQGDVAMIYYTGGTTGRPKGVMHTHQSAMATVLMAATEWEWPPELRFLACTPVSHAAGAFAWPVLLKGGEFHILPAFSVLAFAEHVRRERITMTFLVPTAIYRLLDDSAVSDDALSSLQTLVYGAAPIAPSRLADALGRWGPIFLQLYGQTEAPNLISYLGREQHRVDDPQSLASCGVPLGPIQVALLDDDCRAVPDGEAGEICVRGAFVMKGYWKRPEETAAAFEGGWLHTGDMGRFDPQGRLHVVDRKKDMIISGGFNVYPSEIEGALCDHAAVAECAVVGVPDPVWGESVTAIIIAHEGQTPDPQSLQDLVRARKGAVHVPKRIIFADRLPLTPVGKVDKKAIRASLLEECHDVRQA